MAVPNQPTGKGETMDILMGHPCSTSSGHEARCPAFTQEPLCDSHQTGVDCSEKGYRACGDLSLMRRTFCPTPGAQTCGVDLLHQAGIHRTPSLDWIIGGDGGKGGALWAPARSAATREESTETRPCPPRRQVADQGRRDLITLNGPGHPAAQRPAPQRVFDRLRAPSGCGAAVTPEPGRDIFCIVRSRARKEGSDMIPVSKLVEVFYATIPRAGVAPCP